VFASINRPDWRGGAVDTGMYMRQLSWLGVLLLAACGDGEGARRSVENDGIIAAGQDQVRAKLKDPSSAEFTNVHVSRKAGVPAVCGEVNARNAFGGMGGKERFIAGGATALESEFAPGEFETTWSQLC
jgi:hypothetical protein